MSEDKNTFASEVNPEAASPECPGASVQSEQFNHSDDQQSNRFVVKSERLNLRNGPGRQFGVVDILQRGTVVVVQELPLGVEVPGWELVFAGDSLIGWVARPFIEAVEE